MTFLDMMEIEIRRAGKPITISEAFTSATKNGTINELRHIGKTPQKTINLALHRDIAKGINSRFIQVSERPALFDIKKK